MDYDSGRRRSCPASVELDASCKKVFRLLEALEDSDEVQNVTECDERRGALRTGVGTFPGWPVRQRGLAGQFSHYLRGAGRG